MKWLPAGSLNGNEHGQGIFLNLKKTNLKMNKITNVGAILKIMRKNPRGKFTSETIYQKLSTLGIKVPKSDVSKYLYHLGCYNRVQKVDNKGVTSTGRKCSRWQVLPNNG